MFLTNFENSKHNKQGRHDDSRRPHGQALEIYRYSMVCRETGAKKFLNFTQKLTDAYLKLIPDDYVPY